MAHPTDLRVITNSVAREHTEDSFIPNILDDRQGEAATKTAASTVNDNPAEPFSWCQPHVCFTIILVGSQEVPFAIQTDFLRAKSHFYRRQLAEQAESSDSLERVFRLPEYSPQIFGLAQQFMYEGNLYSNGACVPTYDALFGAWKIGHYLEIDGLCENVIQSMSELRRISQKIPATPLLVEVWKDAPKGSNIRSLLLEWTSEYMRRSADSREDFAMELPHGVLTELVVKMAHLPVLEAGRGLAPPPIPPPQLSSPSLQPSRSLSSSSSSPPLRSLPHSALSHRADSRSKNVHYMSEDSDGELLSSRSLRAQKRQSTGSIVTRTPTSALRLSRKSGPIAIATPSTGRRVGRPPGSVSHKKKFGVRKLSLAGQDASTFSTTHKLQFCQDLIARMLSGPGFWTRLVGPFKQPVDVEADGVPDYYDKIKQPMDLSTIKLKIDRGEYRDEVEFAEDVRLIFKNCYSYWSEKDAIWAACERLEKTFEEKFGQMGRWISKMDSRDD